MSRKEEKKLYQQPLIISTGLNVAGLGLGTLVHFTGIEKILNGYINPSIPRPILVGIPVVLSGFVLQWMAFKVIEARFKYDVKWPTLYASKAENKSADEFNCVQRAHQHTLENNAQFLGELAVAAYEYPISSSIFGSIFVLSRVFFAHGYYTGVAKNRDWGSFGYFALLGLRGLALLSVVNTARRLL